MFKWEKLGKIFDPTKVQSRDWINQFAQAPSLIELDDRLRVFFSCRPKPDANGQYVSYCAYVDLDKNDFSIKNIANKPILDLGKLGTFDEFGTYPVSVIESKGAYFAYYGGWTRCESVPFNVAIGLAISNDCITFKKVGSGPILSYSPSEPFILSGPKIRRFGDKFYLFYIAGRRWILDDGKPEPVYKIRMASSNDGLNFKKHDYDLIVDKLGIDEAQASPDVIYANGKYHMFFCYRKAVDFRKNIDNTYRIGYAYSNDLINWTRNDSKCGLDVSKNGWDSEMVAYPHLFELNGEIYMFYLGNEVGKYGFGLAKLNGVLD